MQSATLLTRIVSLDPIYFDFEASGEELSPYLKSDGISSERISTPIFVKLSGEQDFIHEGSFDFVDNEIDESTGTLLGRAIFKNPETTPLFYGGKEGVSNRIKKAEQALDKYRRTGEMEYVDAYNPGDEDAAMFFPLDYYGNPDRGAVKAWKNRFAVAGWKEWLELDAIAPAKNIKVPTLIIHSDGSALPDNVRRFYELLAGPKDLYWTIGEHTEFYDRKQQVTEVAQKVANHFNKYFMAPANK